MTDERYEELVNEAIRALKLDIISYVSEKYPEEADAFEAKINEFADAELDEPDIP